MKRIAVYFLCITTILVVSCKSEKKTPKLETEVEIEEVKEDAYLDKLIDLRDVNRSFVEGYIVEKFGMQKVNDSIYGFVFKLDNSVTPEMVELYSVGLTGYNTEAEKNFKASFSPKLELIEGNQFIVLKRELENYRHFDSISVYIYARKNWKKSGSIGSFKVRDVLFED